MAQYGKFGHESRGDYSEFENDGTYRMEGNATVYDDIKVYASAVKLTGINQPKWTKFRDDGAGSTGVYLLAFDSSKINEVWFQLELDHSWMIKSMVEPHVHWSPGSSRNTGNVVWKLEYTWSDIFEVFPNTVELSTTDAALGTTYNHQYASFGGLTPPAAVVSVSSVLLCRLYRDTGDAADTFTGDAFFIDFGIHIEKDTLGSRSPAGK
jgi:hypothetical protein